MNTLPPSAPDPTAAKRTAWMHQAKLGLSTHHFPREVGQVEAVTQGFDVETVAQQCEAAGAKWFMFTVHHQPWLMQAPNAELDRITGRSDLTAQRDLPVELYDALARRGIHLMLYVNLRIDPQSTCHPDAREALGPWPPEDRTMQQVADVWREFSQRYGEKVVGWWVDGVWTEWFKQAPDDVRERWFGILADGLRAGNPNAAVAMNAGVNQAFFRYSKENDYTAGEANTMTDPPTARWVDGAQWHVWPHLGQWWGSGGTQFNTKALCRWARRVVQQDGVMCFDIGTNGLTRSAQRDPEPVRNYTPGTIDPVQVAQIRQVRAAIDEAR